MSPGYSWLVMLALLLLAWAMVAFVVELSALLEERRADAEIIRAARAGDLDAGE